VLGQDPNLTKGHLRRGYPLRPASTAPVTAQLTLTCTTPHISLRSIALIGLGRHADALVALTTADRLTPGDKTVQQWLRKAEVHAPASPRTPTVPAAPAPATVPSSQAKPLAIK